MVRVALTGGIASGKTTVADELARHGATVIDSDLLAREVVEPGTPGLRAVVERFGPGVLDGDQLDRAALAAVVFADPEARRDLEAIIHPEVRRRSLEIESALPSESVVVHVIPLLVETGLEKDFDLVVVVDVDHETQVERLAARNAMSRAEAERRIAAQVDRGRRLAAADLVIDNTGDREAVIKQINHLWTEIRTADPAG